MTKLLEVRNLTVRYGRVEAVHDLSLDLDRGAVVTVIGANGAGKSTTLNAIIGLIPSDGTIRFGGQDIQTLSTEARVDLGLCIVPEKRELFVTMNVEDNLILGAYSHYRRGTFSAKARLEEVYALFPRLLERRRQIVGTLSGGERQMLAIGRALMAKPRVLMLDEPSLGLAPRLVREIFRVIAELKKSDVSILLVEQNARAALRLADFGYVLDLGTISLSGASRELAADERVALTYLGKSLSGAKSEAALVGKC